MKTKTLGILTGVALASWLFGEPIATTRNAIIYIPDSLEVPTFVPPAPPVVKIVPVMRIDSAVNVPTNNSRTLTLLRSEASTLPDIPTSPPPTVRKRPQLTPEEIPLQAEERRLFLQFDAEVYDNGVSVIRWNHPDTTEAYEAICGFDVNLLAGIGQFTRDGKIYQLSFLPPGALPSELAGPESPAAAADSIIITRGNPSDPIGTATVTLLRDLIASEKERLIIYQEKRTSWQEAATAWEIAHPRPARDETFWFKPHRGSRYLTQPTPEKGATR